MRDLEKCCPFCGTLLHLSFLNICGRCNMGYSPAGAIMLWYGSEDGLEDNERCVRIPEGYLVVLDRWSEEIYE